MVQRELALDDYLVMLRRHWLLITVLAVVGAIGAYAVTRFLANEFTSQSTVLVVDPTVPRDVVRPLGDTNVNQLLTFMRQEILSRESLEPLIRQDGLYGDDINKVPIDALVARLQKHIAVVTMRPADDNSPIPGFSVAVTTDKPQTSQAICTTVTSMFINTNIRRRQERSESTTQFLSQQIADAKAKLDEQDSKLAAFQAVHPGSLPDDEQTNLGIMSGLSSELAAVSQDINRAQQDKSLAEATLQQQMASRQASQTGKNPQTLEEQLAALQTQMVDLQSRYTDSYPDVVKTKSEITELQKRVAEADAASTDQSKKPGAIEPLQFIQLRAQIRGDEQTIAARTKQQQRIQEQLSQIQGRIREIPAVEEEYKRLTRDHQSALEFYNSLLRKQSDSVMASNLELRQESEQFRLLGPATLPSSPSWPNRPLFAAGGLGIGLLLGVGLALFMEMRDSSLRTERDVELQLQLPVVAVIPSVDLTSSNNAPQRTRDGASSSGLRLGEGA
jgi:polysaccharide chain length determinant protein (PEP-CTERM system associated)